MRSSYIYILYIYNSDGTLFVSFHFTDQRIFFDKVSYLWRNAKTTSQDPRRLCTRLGGW